MQGLAYVRREVILFVAASSSALSRIAVVGIFLA
jgi:hypothetical protein